MNLWEGEGNGDVCTNCQVCAPTAVEHMLPPGTGVAHELFHPLTEMSTL